MPSFVVDGGKCLEGQVRISGAKNGALFLMAATLLARGTFILQDVPEVQDVVIMGSLLQELGCQVELDNNSLNITTPSQLISTNLDLARNLRASVLLLSPLLARHKKARIPLPGGCAIGPRPIDQHVKALELLGAAVSVNGSYVEASAEHLTGTRIVFSKHTVTGTANGIMAAVLAEGDTVLENAACDPEVVELSVFLRTMGAKIEGVGTDQILIHGVTTLYPAGRRVIPDRIEAGTFMVAAAVTGGNLLLRNVEVEHLHSIIAALQSANVEVAGGNDGLRVWSYGTISPLNNITTWHYPGFPTDLQPQFMVLATQAQGVSVLRETVFVNRFNHVPELRQMGALISREREVAFVTGSAPLHGASTAATDLRAGAALVLAGLAASGRTTITHIQHVDRGYEHLEKKLAQVGADIWRV